MRSPGSRIINHPASKCGRDGSNPAAYVPHTDYPEGSTFQFSDRGPEVCKTVSSRIIPVLDEFVIIRGVPQQRQDVPERRLRDGRGRIPHCVAHFHSPRCSGIQVNVVDARRRNAHELERRRGIKQACINNHLVDQQYITVAYTLQRLFSSTALVANKISERCNRGKVGIPHRHSIEKNYLHNASLV